MGCRNWTSGEWTACQLHQWIKAYIQDREALPWNDYGSSNGSLLDSEDLQQELFTHLQGIRKYVSAMDIADYMDRDDVKKTYGLKKGISLATARQWMHRLDY
jgi:hypothetical protein